MSILSGAIHVLGDVAAPVVKTVGAVLPGSEGDRLSSIGASIANPNVTYTGALNPLKVTNTGGQSWVTGSGNTSTSGNGNQDTGGSTSSTTVLSGNTNPYSSASYTPQYTTYGNEANTALNDLLNSYTNANKTANNNFTTTQNQLQSGYDQSKQNYDQSVTSANQDLLRQENSVRQNTNQAYHNLMNLLGAYGAGGSSTALMWAPEMASKFQTAQLQGADQNNAKNLQTLATNWNTFENTFDNQKKQNQDALNNALAQNDANYNTTKSQLNDILGQISSRAIDPTTIGSNLTAIRASIPNTRFVQPTYNGTTPTYATPQLSSFETAAPTTQLDTQLPSNSSATPAALLALLNPQQKKSDQLQTA